VVAAYLPPGWPAGVHPPGTEGFEQTAVTWLLDVVPPDYRLHGVLRRHPIALAALARHHVEACVTGAREGYRTARAELGDDLPPGGVTAVLAAYRSEGSRLVATARAVDLINRALHGEVFTPRLAGSADARRGAASRGTGDRGAASRGAVGGDGAASRDDAAGPDDGASGDQAASGDRTASRVRATRRDAAGNADRAGAAKTADREGPAGNAGRGRAASRGDAAGTAGRDGAVRTADRRGAAGRADRKGAAKAAGLG